MIQQHGIRTISFLGAGNIAWHLGKALLNKGYIIREVYSRSENSASELASALGCRYTCSAGKVTSGSDLYILCVSDSAMNEVIGQLSLHNTILVHTAGSVSMDLLANTAQHVGVFYPLQTFSKQVPATLNKVPFFLEASDTETLEKIMAVAHQLSDIVHVANSQDRLLLHVAAVFASNYTNLMYTLAEEILSNAGLSFDILHPLITETARKAVNQSPSEVQTGPARRKDQLVINKHLQILESHPETKEIYKLLAEMIDKRY